MKDRNSNDCLVIDPGLDAATILNTIEQNNLKPIAVLSTHGHFDHIGSVHEIKQKFHVPFYLGEADVKMSRSANFYLKLAKLSQLITVSKPDVLMQNETEQISIGNFHLTAHNYPGHSSGSYVLSIGDLLFSGDIVYKKGLGFNNFPGEDLELLRKNVLRLFSGFKDRTLILPGHGEAEYLVNIKNNNPDLRNFLNLNKAPS